LLLFAIPPGFKILHDTTGTINHNDAASNELIIAVQPEVALYVFFGRMVTVLTKRTIDLVKTRDPNSPRDCQSTAVSFGPPVP